jgi:hypothetical protein
MNDYLDDLSDLIVQSAIPKRNHVCSDSREYWRGEYNKGFGYSYFIG